jgi:hypothetical protein
MAVKESLENLIEGIAGAVVEAQRRIELRQIENLRGFFDKHDRPKAIDIRLPSLDPRAKPGQDDLYRVPLLPLVASSLLRIKEVEISFDADLLGVTEDGNDKTQAKDVENQEQTGRGGKEKRKTVSIDMRGGVFRGKAATVHVVLKVEGRELSEGMARLIDRLIQSQGAVEAQENSQDEND